MATAQFKLPIGAKRQVTIPRDCMDLLSLEEGGELLLEIVGDRAVLLPVVSIPRRDLPEDLRKEFEARRGNKPTDIPLGEFLGGIGYTPLNRPSPDRSRARKEEGRPCTPRRPPAPTPPKRADRVSAHLGFRSSAPCYYSAHVLPIGCCH
jgi:bifunctional DNA-binding transcriptional regulator/antitoxin component of YhaV-PrlF toxin-antitoxin module